MSTTAPALSTKEPLHPKSPLRSHILADILPRMKDRSYLAHVEDVKQHGQIDDIVLIKEDGEDFILDGRHTHCACLDNGMTPRYRYFGSRESDGDDPVVYVRSKNVERRHLTPIERIEAATNFIPLLEAEARRRMEAGQFKPKAPAKEAKPEGKNVPEAKPAPDVPPISLPGASPASAPTGETPLLASEGETVIPAGDTNAPGDATPPPAPATGGLPQSLSGSKKGRVNDLVAEIFGVSSSMVRMYNRLKKKAPDLCEKCLNREITVSAADKMLDERIAAEHANGKKAEEAKQRAEAIVKIREHWGDKYRDFVDAIEAKKYLSKHADLLVFADLAKKVALPLLPLIKLGFGPERAREFLAGKVDVRSEVNDMLLAAISNHKGEDNDPVERVFELITPDLGHRSNWTVVVQWKP